jgi:hypothetical protein
LGLKHREDYEEQDFTNKMKKKKIKRVSSFTFIMHYKNTFNPNAWLKYKIFRQLVVLNDKYMVYNEKV